MQRLRTILAITAVRLSIVYTLVFGVVAVALVLYMTGSTFNILRRQIQESINAEVADLQENYETGGIDALVRMLERAAAAPGANLYVLADPAGQIIAANIRNIEGGIIATAGWTMRPFRYTRYQDGGRQEFSAVARVLVLPNEMRLLVGRDLGDPERFRKVIARALTLSLGFMAVAGIVTWFLVGRRALKRLDMVSRSTEAIMAGDLSERLPVTGAGDEFDRLSVRLNAMLDRIGKLDEGLRQVSDNIAHDLKTPLTRLRNKADHARQAAADQAGTREALAEVIADTDQIIKTFDAILMISRVESGSAVAGQTRLDLSALVADVADLYGPVAEEDGFEFSTGIEPQLDVRGNRELLSQALSNLCDNALKYGRAADRAPILRVVAVRADGHARVSVCDNGPGIAPQDRERAVERFTRLEASRSQPGNGLGLSLVRAVAQMHGGVFEFADNEPGLRASLVLPLAGPASS